MQPIIGGVSLILLLAALPAPSRAASANSATPKRNDGGQKPSETKVAPNEPWREMDYGPFLTATIEAPQPKSNLTMKGLMISLDADSQTYALFDTDLLRFSAVWTGGIINWRNILFDGTHGKHASIVGNQLFANPPKPGWARSGSFDDPRALPYGPLPHDHARYRGLFLHGHQVVLSYKVGDPASWNWREGKRHKANGLLLGPWKLIRRPARSCSKFAHRKDSRIHCLTPIRCARWRRASPRLATSRC